MSILKPINALRRKLMHSITKNVGKSYTPKNQGLSTNIEIKRVLISRPNQRLGNLLLITPLLQEIITMFPQCKIDLFVKGNLSSILFENYENIDRIIQLPKKPFKHLIKYVQVWLSLRKRHYDIVINIDNDSSSGRLSTQFVNSTYKIFGDTSEEIKLKYKDFKHLAKYPVYNLREYLFNQGIEVNEYPIPVLNLKLSTTEIEKGKKTLNDLVNNTKKTICIFTFATGNKCYSETWWSSFYEKLKEEYSNYNIIEVLPIENISKIGFKAPTFYSNDIREIGSVIANTEVFIGADSGIMHLASSSLTPTIGLFSVTNQSVYEPYGNNNMSINTNNKSNDDCIKIVTGILGKS
ncbi:MAG: glycosyltransferase family 9 protein [Flavobacteriaceae bacterium]|nr:glycosyltransferase family 9 protein [Flavobacteriaceae bacterium]